MDFKNISELSNIELKLYEKELNDEFESVKSKIEAQCKYLEVLDREYGKLRFEQDKRVNKV